MRMRHIVVCALSGPTVFFHILINGTILEKKVTEHKMCVVIFSTPCPRHLSCQEETREIQSKMYIGFHVKCLLFLFDFNET
jgi:hypothetical protein